jgi:segregation and condensation protein B
MEEEISSRSVEEVDNEREMESLRKLEAALFIAGKFLSVPELVALTDINPILLKKMLEDLQDGYQEKGMVLIEQNGKWKMDVAPEYAYLVNKLATGNSEFSKAEQETLAIIAYKQPIKQSIVVKIRGNKAYEHIKQFADMGLITKKKMGHTSELNLSEKFFDYFHVENSGADGNN